MLTLKRAGVNLAALLGGVAVSGFAFGTQAQDSGALASDGEVQEKAEGAYLKQYHFDVYDDLLKTEIKDISDNYLE